MTKPIDHPRSGRMEPLPGPFGGMYPNMRYFEIDSVKAGARYAVWISTPEAYDQNPEQHFPAIYMPDGNWNATNSAGLCDLDVWDLIDPFQPTIQICVGYLQDEAKNALALRSRDLLPPQEPLPPGIIEHLTDVADSNRILDRAGTELYAHYLQNPAGDRFLAFLNEELHPLILENYRIDPSGIGLFGHSYGGLFATYAAVQKTTIFKNICASSPGIIPEVSKVFALYRQAAALGSIEPRNLLLTVAGREISDSALYAPIVGAGSVEFMRMAATTPIEGLTFAGEIFDKETHITVKPAAIYSFLRRFYLRRT